MSADTQWWNEWNERVKHLSPKERQREIGRLNPEQKLLAQSLTENKVVFNKKGLLLFLAVDALVAGSLIWFLVFMR